MKPLLSRLIKLEETIRPRQEKPFTPIITLNNGDSRAWANLIEYPTLEAAKQAILGAIMVFRVSDITTVNVMNEIISKEENKRKAQNEAFTGTT